MVPNFWSRIGIVMRMIFCRRCCIYCNFPQRSVAGELNMRSWLKSEWGGRVTRPVRRVYHGPMGRTLAVDHQLSQLVLSLLRT